MNDDNTQTNMPTNQSQGVGQVQNDLDFDQINPDFETPGMAKLQKRVLALPTEANDTDLIEKEWVTVLQDIVAHTSEDPFVQQDEISKIKADYMKKRYNRDVKRGE